MDVEVCVTGQNTRVLDWYIRPTIPYLTTADKFIQLHNFRNAFIIDGFCKEKKYTYFKNDSVLIRRDNAKYLLLVKLKREETSGFYEMSWCHKIRSMTLKAKRNI